MLFIHRGHNVKVHVVEWQHDESLTVSRWSLEAGCTRLHENACSMTCENLIRHIATHCPGHLVGSAALQAEVADNQG